MRQPYAKTFESKGTTVKIVFINTTPLIDKYRKDSETYPDASAQDPDAQLMWLDQTLADAKEDWTVVVGHHPIYADTDKSESERSDMQRKINPILRKHKVAMYICGHIHNFQHIIRPDSPVDYVVNSSGSLSRTNVNAIDGTVFISGKPGFSVLSASKETLTLSLIDGDGNVIHKIEKRK